jgi:copper chaperone CopZ
MTIRPAALLLAAFAPVAALLTACDGRTPPPRIDGTPVTVRFQVEGMHCGGCAEAIVAELRETPGVRGAQCSFDTKVAEVELLPTTSPDDAAAAIRKLGYKVSSAPASAADSK